MLLDARFEVIGAPYSLLSVSLSASQKLYTRRGTLVGVSGKVENVCEELLLYNEADIQRRNQHSPSSNLSEEPLSAFHFSTNESPPRAQ